MIFSKFSSIYIPDYHRQFFETIYARFQDNIKEYLKYPDNNMQYINFQFLKSNANLGEFNLVKLDDNIAPLLMNSFEIAGQYFCGILPMISLDGKKDRSDYALYMDVYR